MFDITILPIWHQLIIAIGFGLIIGSFLNVYIYRLHTGKSLAGHSHCMSCGRPLRWYELFPVLSYLALRARCRTCGCRIPARYAIVESFTAFLFALTVLSTQQISEMLFLWVIMSILVVITVYDINHYIIPDSLTASLIVLLLGKIVYLGWLGAPLDYLFAEVYYALAGVGFFLFLWVVSKGKWLGFGDVKLAFPLGLLVGSAYVFSMIVFSFWIGAIISLLLVGAAKLQRGKLALLFGSQQLTIKSVVPFAPFLIAGSLLVFFTHINVISLFSH